MNKFQKFTMSLWISSWNLNMMRWRVVTDVFLHDEKARFAANTAALNSSLVVKGTWQTTSCVAYHDLIDKLGKEKRNCFQWLLTSQYIKIVKNENFGKFSLQDL